MALENISEAFKNIKFRSEIEDFSFILEFNAKAKIAPYELLEDSLKLIDNYALKNNRKIIAAFDEFGDIKKLDGEHIVKLFRSIIQHQKNTAFLFSGSYESVMNELFVSKNSPFYRMTRIIELGNIERQHFLPYIERVSAKYKLPISQKRANQIIDFTDGHPYYTQLYLQVLLINARLSDENEIANHKETIDYLLIVEKSFLEKNWEDISKKRENKIVLTTLVSGVTSIYSEIDNKRVNIARALNSLKVQGLISLKDSHYQINDPLLKEWISRNVLR